MTPLDLAAQKHIKDMLEEAGDRSHGMSTARARISLVERNTSWFWPGDSSPDLPQNP